ncbi:hypothetical protein ACEXQE_06500 [Herbiconiux sp. P17]|uniref:hypothetical protein n=1 Tax=Herbiconiux wuyangfengii TaxID=3342794 RepID=UPI0035B794BD
MTSPQDDAAHRRATAAQEALTHRSRSLWALTIVGVILLPTLFGAYGTFTAFFFILSPPTASQITQGTVIMFVGCGVQLVASIGVFAGAAKHGMTAQIAVTVTWLLVSLCAVFGFFSIAAGS